MQEDRKMKKEFQPEGEIEVEISDSPKNLIEYEDFAKVDGEVNEED